MTPIGPKDGPDEALSLLGLARRAGAVRIGAEATGVALRKGTARFVLLAGDASEVQKEKILRVLRHRDVPSYGIRSGDALGAALGEGPLTAVAVTDAGFAERLDRLLSARGEDGSVKRR